MEFEWDAINTKHLGRHKITPQEAEEVLLLDSLESEIQEHVGEQRVLCFAAPREGGC